MLLKIYKKLLKYLFRFMPSNGLRIYVLRLCGYKIGNDVYVGEDFLVSDTLTERNNLIIKDRVSIAPRVTIVTNSSPNNSILIKKFPLQSAKVVINNDAWIGTGVIILQGVSIGECSVIGAGSLVKDDIPPYSIAVGSPAKVIKKIELNENN